MPTHLFVGNYFDIFCGTKNEFLTSLPNCCYLHLMIINKFGSLIVGT